ncbi:predicted protein [Naegleria gruberi]|uniref:Predicted protein n=1 Tax=Naegleria gruberi TaxID=5762 RepID=D2VEN9_NAEGR|nr:uncharacterized protein NAEGRDRAFT_67340 [Naegleria gruberi]EFC44536.1 predicted protein [Naegleria gruberi]|eukprot:XP_002677280.1 predicted protein [Naegleria gruberi strain NEG-M]
MNKNNPPSALSSYDYASDSNPDVLQRIDAGTGRFKYATYYLIKRPMAAFGFFSCAASFFSMVASLVSGQNARTVKFWNTSFVLSAAVGLLSIQYYSNNPPKFTNYGEEAIRKGIAKYSNAQKNKPKWEN